MHFDDSLETVLAADISTGSARQSNWRQLVDLIGRRRAPPLPAALDRLATLRDQTPTAVRAASARALAFADPPAALVALFASDEAQVAAPVLRTARLAAADWIALLADLSPAGRAVLRHRRDLTPDVVRALEAYGSTDFVLGDRADAAAVEAPASPPPRFVPEPPLAEARIEPEEATASEPQEAIETSAEPDIVPATPLPAAGQEIAPASPFVSVGDAVRSVPAVAEALRSHRALAQGAGFEIAELRDRIDRYQRVREGARALPAGDSLDEIAVEPSTAFRFETDATGTVRWVWGAMRSAMIGLAFGTPAAAGGAGVDGAVAGAFRRRAGFSNARLSVAGDSDASGDWRISAVPVFDSLTGRFSGYRGSGRRPRADEQAESRRASPAADSLRQLVHELRTPTTAIIGFAEMIETELLGPVAPAYREHAGAIRRNTEALLGAIEDLDMAARIEGGTLDLRAERVRIQPLVAGVVADLAPLAELRGATVTFDPSASEHAVVGEERAVERLVARLLATLVAASARGERVGIVVAADGPGAVTISFPRPAALAAFTGEALFAIDAEQEDASGAPLLGTGFTLRLARNLARELGGSLAIGGECLTLRLPAADHDRMGQVFSN